MGFLKVMLPIWVIYLALTANLEFANVGMGALIGAGVTLLLRPGVRPIDVRRLPDALLALIQYLAVVAVDVAKSGLRTARIVLTPSLPIQPGIIAIPSQCESEPAIALSAHALTMAPGEMVVEIDGQGTLYTHCLDATHSEEYIFEAQRLRRELLRRILA
jgi:multicomponent Na+:H+ antiporter subunit E